MGKKQMTAKKLLPLFGKLPVQSQKKIRALIARKGGCHERRNF